jgi:hypothetical protein
MFGLWKSVFVLHSGKNLLTICTFVCECHFIGMYRYTKFKGWWKESSDGSTIKLEDQIMFLPSKPGKEERDPILQWAIGQFLS